MLILGSTSRYRRAQLESLGLVFETRDPLVDESVRKAEGLPPDRLALELASEKARSVAEAHPGAVVIAGDQLVALGTEIFGKPGSREAAVEQLQRLAGKTHALLTAVAVAHPGGLETHLDRTLLSVRLLSRGALERYVRRDDPVDCAGAYMIERGGIALFDRIDTHDPSAITGLPLIALVRILSGLGYAIP